MAEEPRKQDVSRLERLAGSVFRPGLVYLYVCVIYLGLPSNRFSADGLHYNLTAFLTAGDLAGLLRDTAVPGHALWHVAAGWLVRLVGPETPFLSLYLLRLFNTVAALVSIWIFMRLVRRFADRFVTSCAVALLAFSHACLRHFLAVEVYALGTLAVLLLLLFVERSCRRRELGAAEIVGLAMLTVVAVAADRSNLLLVPVTVVFLFSLGVDRAWARTGLYLMTASGAVILLLTGISLTTGFVPEQIAGVLFGGAGHWRPGSVESAVSFLDASTRAVLGRLGLIVLGPLLLALIHIVRHRRTLWREPCFRFLSLYLVGLVLLHSQWEPGHVGRKIALLPVVLLLTAFAMGRTGVRLPDWGRGLAVAMVALVTTAGLAHVVQPQRLLDDDPLYLLSASIREATSGYEVALVIDSDEEAGHPVELASMTFFAQRVEVVRLSEPGLEARLDRLQEAGVELLAYDRGRLYELTPRARR